jgi:hypothetical protein
MRPQEQTISQMTTTGLWRKITIRGSVRQASAKRTQVSMRKTG